MGCPVNQCKRINMYVDSQGIMRANKDLVKHYNAEPLPTLIGKPERIAALNNKIKEDEANLKLDMTGVVGQIPVTEDSIQYTDSDNAVQKPNEGYYWDDEAGKPVPGTSAEYTDPEPGKPVE